MKTAEEWINHWAVTESSYRQKGESFLNWEARRLKEAQLDAYRAGMLRAAEIVPQAGVYGDLNTKARQAILTAANNLKPEDLK